LISIVDEGFIMTKHGMLMVVMLIAVMAQTASSQSANLLFTLERNKNVNKVYYEAKITKDGVLDLREPIHVYWIVWAKDSTGKTREELSLVEKNMVYGCKVSKKANSNNFTMTIVSYPDRVITVLILDGKAVAQTMINGSPAYLDKIYINYRETRMFPKVNYIELFGSSVKTGEPQYEKIKPS
jgi:hypothetical protein